MVVGVVAGCGGGGSTTASSGGGNEAEEAAGSETEGAGGEGEAAGSDLQKEAEAKVAEYEKPPSDWPGPNKAFSPGEGSATVISCGFAAPVCATQAKDGVKAFEAMGWNVEGAKDGKLSAQTQAALVEEATQQKKTGILLVSVDLSSIKAAIDRAVESGVLIGCSMCVVSPEFIETGKVFNGEVNFETQGEISAWAVLAKFGPKATIVQTNDEEFNPPPLRVKGFEKVIEEHCPECELETKPFLATEITKPGPPMFSALLASRPSGLNAVVAHYDGAGIAMAKTVQQSGRTEPLVFGYDGEEEGVLALKTGNPPYGATTAEAYTYAEWALADQIARKAAGAPEWEGLEELPSQLITANNADEFLNPYHDPVPKGAWEKEYFEKYWK
ncbi:MAG: sugar ABC transporter substrate-binding protein [Actinobacteria bacterium]|nr:sugar ABC transporter substrate-binding protein [Actinomycetota bacterium]